MTTEAPVESVSEVEVPASAQIPQTIDYKKVGKALQFVTERARPLVVPVFCKLWDRTTKATFGAIYGLIETGTATRENINAVMEFPVSEEELDFIVALVRLNVSIR